MSPRPNIVRPQLKRRVISTIVRIIVATIIKITVTGTLAQDPPVRLRNLTASVTPTISLPLKINNLTTPLPTRLVILKSIATATITATKRHTAVIITAILTN
jgi:hypothetical protein